MEFIADLEIHSKYSRAVSKDMTPETISAWAKKKGIGLVGTGDFTHPQWFAELKQKLAPTGSGFFTLKGAKPNEPQFILSAEVSCIYSKNGRGRRVHVLLYASSFEAAEAINARLGWIGNLKSDGRPILGLDAKELAKAVLEAAPDSLIIPAHIWTPWFSLFGSESGFDSIKECFEEFSDKIAGLETGLSSNPPMNWRLSQIDPYAIVSFSDAHSAPNLGREATIFSLAEPSYAALRDALFDHRNPKANRILKTIEFFPEEGKYHYDGHRDHNVRWSPAETKANKGVCPVCGKGVTVGVMHRVDLLADRPENTPRPDWRPGYVSLVPLQEIIAEAFEQKKGTKKVDAEYESLVATGGGEFNVLLNVSSEELRKLTSPRIAEAIDRVRAGRVDILPGYDGVFGTVKVFSEKEASTVGQAKLI